MRSMNRGSRNPVFLFVGIVGLALSALLLVKLRRHIPILPRLRTSRQVETPIRLIAVIPDRIYCDHPCIVFNVKVIGSGFAMGQRVTVSPGNLLESRIVSGSQILLSLSFDALSFSPGLIRVTISAPTGGSGSALMMFLGNGINTATANGSEIYNLDQGAGMVHVFDTPAVSGAIVKPKRSCFIGASLASSMAFDNENGVVVVAKSNFIMLMRPDNCQIVRVIGLWAKQAVGTGMAQKSGQVNQF